MTGVLTAEEMIEVQKLLVAAEEELARSQRDVETARLAFEAAKEAHGKTKKAVTALRRQLCDDTWSDEKVKARAKSKTWRTATGDEIKYSDMEDRHLLHAIAYVEHHREWNAETGARTGVHPALSGLKAEADRRGLDVSQIG